MEFILVIHVATSEAEGLDHVDCVEDHGCNHESEIYLHISFIKLRHHILLHLLLLHLILRHIILPKAETLADFVFAWKLMVLNYLHFIIKFNIEATGFWGFGVLGSKLPKINR